MSIFKYTSPELALRYIIEEVDKAIDKDSRKMLKDNTVRQAMLDKFGKTAFLDPTNLKFPIIDPTTGEFDCKLIYASFVHSSFWQAEGSKNKPKEYFIDINEKAKKAFKKHKCEATLKMKLSTEDEFELSLIDVYNLFFIKEQEVQEIAKNVSFLFLE